MKSRLPMNLLSMHPYLQLLLISMLPIVELRGGIPYGVMSLGLPFSVVYPLCVLGNILPVPFLIKFSKAVLSWLAEKRVLGGFFQKIIDRADAKAKTIGKFELLGLFLFVAIPLPGTGAWTGSLIAAILRLRLVPAFLVITLGVLTSGFIMGILSYGLLGAFGIIF